ncbi:hypothetical protein [Actinomadura macra]|nr:hypothetical protein [Actinomadura macra]
MNRKKLGLLAVAFVLVVGLMEVLALKVGSMEFAVPDKKPAVADKP